MSYSYVVADYDLLYAENNIEVSNRYVIIYLTLMSIDDAHANTNSLTNFVTEKYLITRPLEKTGQQRHTPEHRQPEFAGALHLVC